MNISTGQIFFHYLSPLSSLKNRTSLKVFIKELIWKEGKQIDTINYIFCSDEYLLPINREYLKHDTLTDIITFELNMPTGPLLSDIYISVDRVKENAQGIRTSFQNELLRVIFHGALHLCGYNDKTMSEVEAMRSLENHYLSHYLVSRETGKHI